MGEYSSDVILMEFEGARLWSILAAEGQESPGEGIGS